MAIKKRKRVPDQEPAQPIEERPENISLNQKKIAFVNSTHLDAVLAILKDSFGEQKLLGANEFETVKNAVTLEANSNTLKAFIKMVDYIKAGGLHQII